MTFQFPHSSFKAYKFESIASLKEALISESSRVKATYKVASNSKYVTLKCKSKGCRSKLTYRIFRKSEGQGLILAAKRFENGHNHSNKDFNKQNHDKMIEYLRDAEMYIASPNAFNVLKKEFNITKNQYYYLRKKETRQKPLRQYLDELRERGYKIDHTPWV